MRTLLFLMTLWFIALTAWAESPPKIDTAIAAYQHRDYPSALAGFSELAKAGDSRAQTIFALMHRFGEGTPVDLPLALHWYQQAANAGYAPAEYHLANMLAAGIGTVADEQAAIRWLRAAEQSGFSRASVRLAEIGLTAYPLLADAQRADSQFTDTEHSDVGLTDTSLGVREIVEWNLRLPNQWRLSPLDGQDEAHAIDHLPRVERQEYRIQLGMFSSRSRAVDFWQNIMNEHPDLFIDLRPFIESSQSLSTAQQTPVAAHRIQAGTFGSFSAAAALCNALLAAEVESGCLPIAVARATAASP
ncbi:MAG: hypothetical protein ACI81O_000285 [Cyclobacteriaceae bacterium]|jgi:hypothetical protein